MRERERKPVNVLSMIFTIRIAIARLQSTRQDQSKADRTFYIRIMNTKTYIGLASRTASQSIWTRTHLIGIKP